MSDPAQQPGYPVAPPQGYPPPAPPAPQQPGYPVAAAPPAPAYGPPQPPAYGPPQAWGAPPAYGPPQGWGAQPQQAPPVQLAEGSLEQYWAQPSAGQGKALAFLQPGTTHVGVVARPITNGDIQQQTQRGSGLPATYKDGRPKFVMKVPLRVHPSPEHPDGLAQWWVSGQARDELVRAMNEVGAPQGPPEPGAVIQVTFTHERAAGGGNPAKVYAVTYRRPDDATPLPAAPPAQPAPQPVAYQQPPVPQPSNGYPGSPGTQQFLPPPPPAPVAQPAPAQPAPVAQQVPPPPAPPAPQPAAAAPPPPPAPPAPGGLPPGMTPEQAAIYAQLTGQPVPA